MTRKRSISNSLTSGSLRNPEAASVPRHSCHPLHVEPGNLAHPSPRESNRVSVRRPAPEADKTHKGVRRCGQQRARSPGSAGAVHGGEASMRSSASGNEVPLPLDRYPLPRSSSLDEVRQLYSNTARPTRLEVPRRARFQCRLNYAAVGPVTISTIWSRSSVVGVAETPLSSYFLGYASAGRSEHVVRRRSSVVVANQSGVCASPSMAPTARLQAGYRGVQVKIERTAMEGALAALLCVPSRAPLILDTSFSVTSGYGADAVRFLDFLIAELDQGSAWLRTPIVANRWLEGFLFPHAPRAPEQPFGAAPRAPRRRGASPPEPGRGPLEFLRAQRFEHARQRLLGRAGHPASSVTLVAMECGFGHLGRFSIDYRARFGESPKETRRRAIGDELPTAPEPADRNRTRT